jgi:hypothetical protein
VTEGLPRDQLLPGVLTWTSLALLTCLVLTTVSSWRAICAAMWRSGA